ncbi:hypothetical protein [Sulfuricurvum sp.]|uniref:hypothetical protein n=1 Tax=Sulfuricurvum sp. TaxID=2025608 RepID=UPI0019B21E5D|nr:hypothetical protein [Sulfuricurvum sp.]MBD3805784.1 hypothetical protein [Sulfuricurvum sp.]
MKHVPFCYTNAEFRSARSPRAANRTFILLSDVTNFTLIALKVAGTNLHTTP